MEFSFRHTLVFPGYNLYTPQTRRLFSSRIKERKKKKLKIMISTLSFCLFLLPSTLLECHNRFQSEKGKNFKFLIKKFHVQEKKESNQVKVIKVFLLKVNSITRLENEDEQSLKKIDKFGRGKVAENSHARR